jgi:hypothetical protein
MIEQTLALLDSGVDHTAFNPGGQTDLWERLPGYSANLAGIGIAYGNDTTIRVN